MCKDELIMNEFRYEPDVVSPPGSTILDLIEENGLCKKTLSTYMKMSEYEFCKLLAGLIPLNADHIKQLSSFFSIPAEFWISRQVNYDKYLATKEARTLEKRVGELEDSYKGLFYDTAHLEDMLKQLRSRPFHKDKKPHKCLVCDGRGWIVYTFFGDECRDDCKSCEGKGIVWG